MYVANSICKTMKQQLNLQRLVPYPLTLLSKRAEISKHYENSCVLRTYTYIRIATYIVLYVGVTHIYIYWISTQFQHPSDRNEFPYIFLSGNGFIEGSELDGFLREFVTSVNTSECGPEVSEHKGTEILQSFSPTLNRKYVAGSWHKNDDFIQYGSKRLWSCFL